MGNYFYKYEPYTVEETEKETDTGVKNRYYWFGVTDDEIEVYELMEAD